jgi:nitrite reductase/ring-hydroxylating ferredoxin subunit
METTHECAQRDTSNDIVIKPQVTRRHFLRLAAMGLAAVGLSSQAEIAMAASTKVKAGKASDISVKGARAYTLNGKYIIVTQPKAGTYKAFSGICTHQTTKVDSLNGTNLVCRRHNGYFDTTTGAAKGGPVSRGLTSYPVTITSGYLYVTI